MQQNNISLQYGIHRSPSLGEDGELSECVNLIPQDGELVNLQEPTEKKTLPGQSELKLIHVFGNDTFYFYLVMGSLYYEKDGDDVELRSNVAQDALVFAIGNILILSYGGKNYYYRYYEEEFVYLGNHLPELYLSFGLQGYYGILGNLRGKVTRGSGGGDPYLDDMLENYSGGFWPADIGLNIETINGVTSVTPARGEKAEIAYRASDSNGTYVNPRKFVSDFICGLANEFLNDYCYKAGKFAEPFLVRYAYRLFDGTHVMASPPVLMTPTTETAPCCAVAGVTKTSNYITKVDIQTGSVICDLDYSVINDGVDFANWKDIIVAVDIFISQPLRYYKESDEVRYLISNDEGIEGTGYFKSTVRTSNAQSRISQTRAANDSDETDELDEEDDSGGTTENQTYQEWLLSDYVSKSRPGGSRHSGNYTIRYELPRISEKEFVEKVKDTSNFFLLKSIPIEELQTSGRNIIEVEEDYLTSLTAREELSKSISESFSDHDTYIPSKLFDYNSRLNMIGVNRYVFDGFPAAAMIPYINGPDTEVQSYMRVYVTRKTDTGKEIYTCLTANEGSMPVWPYAGYYFYFPDENAVTLRVAHRTTIAINQFGVATLNMVRHSILPGTVYFKGYQEGIPTYRVSDPPAVSVESDRYISQRNKIYLSRIDNPFGFNSSDITTLPTEEVLMLSTAAKALSQGQFGQFPLYAFCSDGIWALTVSDTGVYGAKQPISRDVCTNPDSITQIDNAVVFVTNQGLKLISGSDVVLLSGPVDGYNLNESFIEDALTAFATKVGEDSPYVGDASQFITQVQTARIVYDYAHNLLHVFHDNESVGQTKFRHYVFSFDTKQWSTQVLPWKLTTALPGYPLSTMQFGDKLYQYEKTTDETMRIGYALTRPLALGDPLSRKALYDLRIVGQRTNDSTTRRVAVYVSNDNVNWYRLKSLKALSARYYRFLVMTYQSDIDTMSGLSLQYDYRYNHKMRRTIPE